MRNLKEKLKKIPKAYFTFADLRKIAGLSDNSLRVAVSRLKKQGEITAIIKGYYTVDPTKVDYLQLAQEINPRSYLSFESALAYHNILSQQPVDLTLATDGRSRQIKLDSSIINFHQLQKKMFFGFINDGGCLIATPEKAFIDQAYLSLNGYGYFDPEAMNLKRLDQNMIKIYLKKIKNNRLNNLLQRLSVI